MGYHAAMRSPRAQRGASLAAALLTLVGCSDSDPSAAATATGTPSQSASSASSASSGAGGASSAAATSTGTASSSTSNVASSTGGTATATSAATQAASTPTSTTASTATSGGEPNSDALDRLREYLAIERAARPALDTQEFARIPISAADAETARALLWEDYAAFIALERQAEAEAKAITLDGRTLRYDFTTFGSEPESGHSLFISLHGGGEADASVNDQQWENQKGLYQPDEGIYLAPRAPTNTWNLWHEPHIDGLLNRLITNFIVLEGVDPNRVYVMGYSAGGDGVYQLGPRMADFWAAAAMMAGHPNDARPESLRNIGFTIHVGGLDTAFDRNLVAEEWGMLLDQLEAADPGAYPHYVEVHPDKPHWMDLEDAVAVPWMAEFTRNPVPARIVWLQDDVTHPRFYWLAVDAESAAAGNLIEASLAAQTIDVQANGVDRVSIRLSDAMLDLDQPIRIASGATTLFEGAVERTILTLSLTLEERGDPALVFSSEVTVDL